MNLIPVQTNGGLRLYPLGIHNVTYCTLVSGGQSGATYQVLQCKLYVRENKAPFVNTRRAKTIASIHIPYGTAFNYFETAQKYESPTHPAFDWEHTEKIIKESN